MPTLGLRHGEAMEGTTEVDIIVNKARRGGHTGDRIALAFDYMHSDMREVGVFTLNDIKRARAERRDARKGRP